MLDGLRAPVTGNDLDFFDERLEVIHDDRDLGVVFGFIFGAVNAAGGVLDVEGQGLLAVRVEGFEVAAGNLRQVRVVEHIDIFVLLIAISIGDSGFGVPDAVTVQVITVMVLWGYK